MVEKIAVTPVTPWRCHARPATLKGRECGHYNAKGGLITAMFGQPQAYCGSCGCTKIASDLRAKNNEVAMKGQQR